MDRSSDGAEGSGDLVPLEQAILSDDLLFEDRARLADRLARLELERQELISRVRTFTSHYYRELGPRYQERDRLRVHLAERLAAAHPDDAEAVRRVKEHQDAARATQDELDRAATGPADARGAQESLKETYLRLAKLVHPDLASSPEERVWRERLMSELNAAYQSGDAERITDIAMRVSARGGAVRRKNGLRDEIERLEAAIRGIQQEIDVIRGSDMYALMERVERAARRGQDLVQEIARSLDQEIEHLRQTLETEGPGAV